MTGSVAQIQRHPIKSHGRETLASVSLEAGAGLPWDRHWAVAHEAAKLTEPPAWAPCVNFSIGSKAPSLTAIEARLDTEVRRVTLTHPALPKIDLLPDDPADQARFLDWVKPLCPPDRARPARIVHVPGRNMTDTDYPSVSIQNLASGKDLASYMGLALSPLRWRANFWLEGLEPWVETTWIGRDLRVGQVLLHVVEPIRRCRATTANPETGLIEGDTLTALNAHVGTQDFGVYAKVIEGGDIRVGDTVEVLA